jgi:hypothetical protein
VTSPLLFATGETDQPFHSCTRTVELRRGGKFCSMINSECLGLATRQGGRRLTRPRPAAMLGAVRLAAILLGSLTLFAATGCGFDAEVGPGRGAAVVKAARTFESAFAAGDGRAACQAMSPAGRVFAQRRGHSSCVADQTGAGTGELGDWRQAEPHVHQVIVDGDSVVVFFGTSKTRVFEFYLARAPSGRWAVSIGLVRGSRYRL